MKVLAIFASLFLIGCSSNTAIKSHVPIKVDPLAPEAGKFIAPLRDTRAAAEAKSDVIQSQVESINKRLGQTSNQLDQAVTEAKRLRDQKSANEAELDQMWKQLTAIKQNNLFLQKEAEDAVKQAAERKQLADQLSQQINELDQAVRDKDLEASNLHSKLQTSEDFRKQSDQDNSELSSANKKLTAKAADAMVYKKLFWYTVAGFVLLSIARIILKARGIVLPI